MRTGAEVPPARAAGIDRPRAPCHTHPAVLTRLLLLLFACSLGGAPLLWGDPLEVDIGQPAEFDLGPMAPGEARDLTIILHNRSEAEYRIEDFWTTCGCTHAQTPFETLAPGASAELPITFRAPEAGTRTSQIILRPGVGGAMQWAITLRAEVSGELQVQPRRLDFGVVTGDTDSGEIRRRVALVNRGRRAVALLAVSATPEAFSVAAWPRALERGGSGFIDVALDPAQVGDFLDGTLIITVDNPLDPEIHIPLSAMAEGAVRVVPERLWFGPVLLGESRTMTAEIQVPGQETLEITEVESTLPWVSAAVTATRPGALTVTVSLDGARAERGVFETALRLKTTNPDVAEIAIAVGGIVQPRPGGRSSR